MSNPQIKFSKNWNNKLSCKIFSTFRKLTSEKLDYYLANIDSVFDVVLNDAENGESCIGKARLIGIRYTSLSDVPDYLLWLDTGCPNRADALSIFELLGVKESDDVIWLFFQRSP